MMKQVTDTVNHSVDEVAKTATSTVTKSKEFAVETGQEFANMAGIVKDGAVEAADVIASTVKAEPKRRRRKSSKRTSKSRASH